VFWFRQATALAIGLGAGFLHLQGFMVIITFFVAMYLLSYMYSSKVLNVQEDEFQQNELLSEGVGNAFGLFLVSTLNTLQAHFLAIARKKSFLVPFHQISRLHPIVTLFSSF